MEGIIGRKVGMTQVFLPDGRVEPVTVIEAGPCVVTQVRTPDKDGYAAVQLGFEIARRLNRPERGHVKELGNFRILREFRLDDPGAKALGGEHTVGEQITAALFQSGDIVDVVGVSKGRGFQGGVRRHGFRGGPKTHGQSDRHRAPGSIGAGTTPGHVLKGTRMAGHMGAERITERNLTVVRSDPQRNVLLVRGAVPGPRGGLLLVRRGKYRRK